jgi:hypothetical protein
MYVQHNIEARSRSHWCPEKAINMHNYECVSLDLGIQYAKRMLPIILSSVACLAFPYTVRFSGKMNLKYVLLIFSTNIFWNISNSVKKWARYGHNCTEGIIVRYGHNCTEGIIVRYGHNCTQVCT